MKSIRHRILATLLGVGLFPVLVSLIANVTLTKRDALTAKHQEMGSLSVELTRGLNGIMKSVDSDLNSISTNPVLMDIGTSKQVAERKKDEFRRLTKIYDIFSISLLDPAGFEIDSTLPNWSGQEDKTKWFIEALSGKDQITLPEISDKVSPDSPISLAVKVYKPIRGANGKVLNVVRGVVRYEKVWDLLRGVKLGREGYMVLTDERGKVIFHPDTSKVWLNIRDILPIDPHKWSSGEMTTDGRRYIYNITSMPREQTMLSEGWYLISVLPYEEAVAIATQSTFYQGVVAALSVVFGSLLGLIWGRQLTRHISDAAEAAGKVAAGDLETRLPESGPSEMVALATSFNEMTREVKQHRNQLESLVAERTSDLAASREDLAVLAAQLKASFEASRSAILLLRADGQLLAANGLFSTTFGFELASDVDTCRIGLLEDVADCFADPAEFRAVWARAAAGSDEIIDIELDLIKPNKRIVNLYSAPVRRGEGAPVARIWNFRDITEKRGLEMGLRQAQKMEAVGRLAGGVAHDFNNLLQGILGNIALIDQDVGPFASPAATERIAMARNAGQRAAQIVKQLLGFSRLSHLRLARCEVNTVIRELHNIIRSTFDPRVEVTTELQDDSWKLRADATQIEQVVMNMVVNARDAMNGSGRINISTRNIHLGESQLAGMPEGREGEFVRISVTDNGSGMSPETMTKIFEPFFTTKEQGKGTGLGLATSFGIVQQHGGWITCDSVIGTGTTFHIFLPRCTEEEEAKETALAAPVGPVRGGGETILLVDDEMVVRAVAQGLLKKLGYNVVTADDGEAALEMLHQMDGGIHLCLLDLTMPRLSGKDTFAAMRRGPARGVPVVICSGYLVDLDGFAEETGSRPDAFVQKPYALDDLARTIRNVLDSPAPVVAA
ncbi:MAG: Histidine kinase [Verrucomicrobiales bacterium]|nr:Histidine kinase [Verrucomicrobiales bacterium]